MKYKNLTVIGTSHIAKQSLDDVEKTVIELKPDIICLELDKRRLYALLSDQKGDKVNLRDIMRIGLKGYLFSIIGAYVEKKLGQQVGIKPGSEMLKAIELAKKNNIKIAVIDQDIEKTLKRFSQEFSWKERFRLVMDIIKAFIFRKSEIDFDLRTVPSKSVVDKLVKKVKDRYPGVYKVLIEERNDFMASKLVRIMYSNDEKKILAIVGAGHEEEMINLIKKKKVEVVHKGIYRKIGLD
jgi:pheromone shutdown-related protein TraB